MDTESIRRTLGYLWAMVAVARETRLTEADYKELARICENLQERLPEGEELALAICGLCLRVHTSQEPQAETGLLEIDRLLEEIDRVRQMLIEESTAAPRTEVRSSGFRNDSTLKVS